MFKLSEIAPDIAAQLDKYERESAEHRASCREEFCERCGRHRPPPSPESYSRILADQQRVFALDTLPAAFVDASLDADWLAKLVGPDAMEQARGGTTLSRVTFLGPPGSGKTSLAVAMFRVAVGAATQGVRWYRYVSSHALAKARATSSLGEEAPLVERALRAPLLLIDELGGEDARHASAVAEVLYERHAENLATWVTTGVTPKEIATRYGGGIARRVFEGATIFRLGKR